MDQLTTATNARITALEETRDALRVRAERAEADLDTARADNRRLAERLAEAARGTYDTEERAFEVAQAAEKHAAELISGAVDGLDPVTLLVSSGVRVCEGIGLRPELPAHRRMASGAIVITNS